MGVEASVEIEDQCGSSYFVIDFGIAGPKQIMMIELANFRYYVETTQS